MRKYLLALPAIIFFISNLFILSDYGINWDSPLHMLRGQAYADILLNSRNTLENTSPTSPVFLTSHTYASRYYFAALEILAPDKTILPPRPLPQKEFNQTSTSLSKRLSFYSHHAHSGEIFKNDDGAGHLPLIGILSAFSNRMFWGGLGWLGDLESYQIVNVLFSALGIFIVTVFASQITGSLLAGFLAGISLALWPLFFAEAHINSKDPIQASLFAGAVWAFWRWVKDEKLKWFGVFVVFVAFALGVKWNIVFLPLILIPWLLLIKFRDWGRLGKLGILGGLGIILFLSLIWPYSWGKPWVLWRLVEYYLDVGTGFTLIQPSGFTQFFGFNLYPLLLFLSQTPEVILFFGGIGVIWVIKGDKSKTGYLLLLWLLIPLIRIILPGARSYVGIRQIMEVLPVMAILAGVGGWYLAKGRKNITVITIIIIITVILALVIPIIKLHPNQNTYFNSLVGGLKGARDKNLIDWTLTYGNIYKQGALWLNENAPLNSNIAHLSGADFALSPLWLRDDISISPYHFSGFEQKGEYIMSLYNPLEVPVFAKRYPERFLDPVHQVEVDLPAGRQGGVPLLFIYKNEPKYLKLALNSGKELKVVKMIPQSSKEADFWKIDLGRQYQVTRLVVNGVDSKCVEGVEQKEAIAFIPESEALQPVDLTRAYVLNEKKDLGEGRVEYLFAAEEARFIYIYPQNNQSCFAHEKILSVSYLSE